MATKLRLQRHGKKGSPFYFIVAADERAKRDGKFIEKVGTYNPTTNPASIDLNFERALYWVQVGAQPTDTMKNILSKEGVLMKDHLLRGAKKGAFSAEEAEKRFTVWLDNKQKGADKEVATIAKAKANAAKAQLDIETAANKAKADAIALKNTPEVEEVAEEAAPEAEAVTEEAPAAETEGEAKADA